MSPSRTGTAAGATTAVPERAFPAAAPFLFAPDFRGEPSREGSPTGRGWRILRAITQEREDTELYGREHSPSEILPAARSSMDLKPAPAGHGRMELFDLSLRTKSLWLV